MITYMFALLFLCATLIAHLFGIYGWYMRFPAYDIFMHILGGVGIGLFITAFVKSNFKSFAQAASIRRNIVIGVLAVGIVWELFEMYFNIAGAPLWTKAYYIDTAKDLINDCIGGVIVGWICFRKSK